MKKRFTLLVLAALVTSLQTFGAVFKINNSDASATYTHADKPEITSGKIIWDKNTKTVTLDNVSMEFSGSGNCFEIVSGSADITLKLIGENTITTPNYIAFYDMVTGGLTITSDDGTGSLTCNGTKAIVAAYSYANSSLTITNCTVTAVGSNGGGIAGDAWNYGNLPNLIIDNATVKATGTKGNREYGSISWVKEITLNNCKYESPEGVYLTKITKHFDQDRDVWGLTTDGTDFTTEEVVIKPNTAATLIAIDETNFPDANFRAEIKTKKYDDNQDGYLSDEEIETTYLLSLNELGISNLKGLEYFTALKYLHFYNNNVASVDVSMFPDLEIISASENPLTTLDVTHNPNLKDLGLRDCQLTTLDVTQNPELKYLYCQGNNLSTLDVSYNTNLTILWCSDNNLTTLDVSQNTELADFECAGNQLTSLDLTQNKKIVSLDCSYNQLTSLDLTYYDGADVGANVYICGNNIGESAMDALIASLPTATGGPTLYVIDSTYEQEKNVITKAQVETAKAKNWYIYDAGTETPYEGTTGIETIRNAQGSTHNEIYNLQGVRQSRLQKGINIVNGKKIVVK